MVTLLGWVCFLYASEEQHLSLSGSLLHHPGRAVVRSCPSFQGSATLNHRPTPQGRQKLFLPLSQPYKRPRHTALCVKGGRFRDPAESSCGACASLDFPKAHLYAGFFSLPSSPCALWSGPLVFSKCPLPKPWTRPPAGHTHSVLSAALSLTCPGLPCAV